jgi:hypothetical protein
MDSRDFIGQTAAIFSEHPACMRVGWRPKSAEMRPNEDAAAFPDAVTEDSAIDCATP